MDLISFIVPVYNTEKYISKCIKSIINQTYKNIEMILIDDGSTDTSRFICQKYKEQDSRIKVILKKNEGVSKARNLGISVSTGKYLVFVDSDDYINKQFAELLYKNACLNNSDIVMCNFFSCYGIFKRRNKTSKTCRSFRSSDKINDYIINNSIDIIKTASCKMFKSDVIKSNNITFNSEMKQGEDNLFFCECFLNSSKITLIMSECLYYYRKNVVGAATNNITCGSWTSNQLIIDEYFKLLDKYSILVTDIERNKIVSEKIIQAVENGALKLELNAFKKQMIEIRNDIKRYENFISNGTREILDSDDEKIYKQYKYERINKKLKDVVKFQNAKRGINDN